MKLDVPYYSQFVDIQDPFWMLRACGGVSLAMVAEFHGVQIPELASLCNEAKERGGYDMTNGWVHDYLVTRAQEFGLDAYRKEGLTDIEEIIAALQAGNPVIVSVEKRVLEQKRFHMIVLVGYDKSQTTQTNADLADNTLHAEGRGKDAEERGQNSDSSTSYNLQADGYLHYHEPESTDKEKGKFRTCDVATFMQYWRGKAIFIKKKE